MIRHRSCLPVVGNDALATQDEEVSGAVSVGVEVFHCAAYKLVLVQSRAPCIPGGDAALSAWLAQWAKEQGITKALLLSSQASFTRRDKQLDSAPFSCVATSTLSNPSGEPIAVPVEVVAEDAPAPPCLGGGIAKSFFSECRAQGLPLVALSWFSTEGDNSHEGRMLALLADQLLSALSARAPHKQWAVPLAWAAVFGPPADDILY